MMKNILTAATLLALSAGSAAALDMRAPVSRHLYTCDAAGLSRVAFKPTPAPCCEGLLGCPQLLANTGLIKPKRNNRT